MKVQGKFKTHHWHGVVMDIAAFKVCHSVVIDIDATALRAARARSSSIHRGNGGTVWEGSKCKHSPTGTQTSRARAQQSVSSRVSSRGRWNVTCLGSIRGKAHKSMTFVLIHV